MDSLNLVCARTRHIPTTTARTIQVYILMQACVCCLKSCVLDLEILQPPCPSYAPGWYLFDRLLSAATVAETHGTAQHTKQQVLSQDQCLSASVCTSAQLYLSILHVSSAELSNTACQPGGTYWLWQLRLSLAHSTSSAHGCSHVTAGIK